MGELFGTDGIRGIAGEQPLDRNTIYRVGYSLARYLRKTDRRPHVLLARDTRRSGPWIEALLRKAIADAGGTTESCGVLSTPAVAFLTADRGAHAGIMISASHNPYRDNGIKIFSSQGIKFSDAVENELEGEILAGAGTAPADLTEDEAFEPGSGFCCGAEYRDLYLRHLRGCLPAGFSLAGLSLVADCAHGSLSVIAPEFLRSLGARVHAIHCEPDGRNINHNAGALHLDRLRQEVMSRQAGLGVAFDGDADRAMFVDAGGRMRDGDDVLYLLARYCDWKDAPRLVVGTVMANLGLELALQDLEIRLSRTSVGDRYVLEEMLRTGAIIGGEQSGHIIQLRHARTGDGLLTALRVMEVLRREGKEFGELCRPLKRFPQILVNVAVREKQPIEDIPGMREAEAECRRLLGPRSRILLRYSGTEKLARVMVEGESETTVRETAHRLASLFAGI
ncbi:MAG: phosphoglucosamine mutase [Acidobacteriota bacterium]